MELRPYGDDDYDLTVALETDPVAMRELGGPRPLAALPAVHRTRVDTGRPGFRYLKIMAEPGQAAGTIGYWESRWRGEPVHETGWMLLPRFHGRGLARAAIAALIPIAQADPPVAALEAYPGVTNAPSNALCRSAGFELLEAAVPVEFAGRTLSCNRWRLPTPDSRLDERHAGRRARSA